MENKTLTHQQLIKIQKIHNQMYKTSLTSLNKAPAPTRTQQPTSLQLQPTNARPTSSKPAPPVQQRPVVQQAPQQQPIRTQPSQQDFRPTSAKPQTQQRQAPPPQQQYQQPMQQSMRAPPQKRQPQIPMEADRAEPLYDCPEGCGRRFNQVALPKHAKVCKKVFQQKRKEFNSAKQRIVEEEQKKFVATTKGRNQTRPTTATTRAQPQQQIKPKKVDWRAQSEAFRAIVKQSKGGVMSKEQSQMVSQAMSQNLVACKFCGRKFNDSAAQRHIPVCEKKAKENNIKKGPQQSVQSTQKTPVVTNKAAPSKQTTTKLLSGTQRNK